MATEGDLGQRFEEKEPSKWQLLGEGSRDELNCFIVVSIRTACFQTPHVTWTDQKNQAPRVGTLVSRS